MEEKKRIGCVVMAAGSAARFGKNKLAADFEGKALIEHALDAAAGADFDRVAVVTQYPEIEQLAAARGFLPVRNAHPDRGLSHTVALGTTALQDCDAVLYLVCDQPRLSRASVSRLVETWRGHPDKICGAVHGGRRGNPNIFPKRFFPELLALNGDCGGSAVIRRHEDDFFPVELPQAELTDCDTPEALEALKNGQ